jgi:hypothetical protein
VFQERLRPAILDVFHFSTAVFLVCGVLFPVVSQAGYQKRKQKTMSPMHPKMVPATVSGFSFASSSLRRGTSFLALDEDMMMGVVLVDSRFCAQV